MTSQRNLVYTNKMEIRKKREKKTWTNPGDEAEREKKCEPEEKIKSLIAGIDNLFEWNIIFTESF